MYILGLNTGMNASAVLMQDQEIIYGVQEERICRRKNGPGYPKLAIKEALNIPVIAVGLITTAAEGENLLKNNFCDFVAYGRELLRSPNFAFYAAKELDNKEVINTSYERAF